MAITFNGFDVPTDADNVIFNGTVVSEVIKDGVQVWERKAPAGSQIFTANGTFTVPIGIYSVNVCEIGGGGSGAFRPINATENNHYTAGGGYSGAVDTQEVAVTPLSTINVTVGVGGAGVSHSFIGENGLAGSASSFGSLSVAGGAGGIASNCTNTNYVGNGASRTTCGGTATDGIKSAVSGGGNCGEFANGGQAGFGNGGNGVRDVSGGNGGVGAGGGGAIKGDIPQSTVSGSGGRGEVRITWN